MSNAVATATAAVTLLTQSLLHYIPESLMRQFAFTPEQEEAQANTRIEESNTRIRAHAARRPAHGDKRRAAIAYQNAKVRVNKLSKKYENELAYQDRISEEISRAIAADTVKYATHIDKQQKKLQKARADSETMKTDLHRLTKKKDHHYYQWNVIKQWLEEDVKDAQENPRLHANQLDRLRTVTVRPAVVYDHQDVERFQHARRKSAASAIELELMEWCEHNKKPLKKRPLERTQAIRPTESETERPLKRSKAIVPNNYPVLAVM